MSSQETQDIVEFNYSPLYEHAAWGQLELGQEWESDAR